MAFDGSFTSKNTIKLKCTHGAFSKSQKGQFEDISSLNFIKRDCFFGPKCGFIGIVTLEVVL